MEEKLQNIIESWSQIAIGLSLAIGAYAYIRVHARNRDRLLKNIDDNLKKAAKDKSPEEIAAELTEMFKENGVIHD